MEDGFSLATVLASAGVSAVISAVVALLAAGRSRVAQMRAERAEEARVRVGERARAMLLDLKLYSSGVRQGARRPADRVNLGDYELVSGVLQAAEGLGRWRAARVRRRCRIVFGEFLTDLADTRPYDNSSLGSMLAPILTAPYRAEQRGIEYDPLQSAMHLAFKDEPGSPSQRRLTRQLKFLEWCL